MTTVLNVLMSFVVYCVTSNQCTTAWTNNDISSLVETSNEF